jgi:hypothetical protein
MIKTCGLFRVNWVDCRLLNNSHFLPHYVWLWHPVLIWELKGSFMMSLPVKNWNVTLIAFGDGEMNATRLITWTLIKYWWAVVSQFGQLLWVRSDFDVKLKVQTPSAEDQIVTGGTRLPIHAKISVQTRTQWRNGHSFINFPCNTYWLNEGPSITANTWTEESKQSSEHKCRLPLIFSANT